MGADKLIEWALEWEGEGDKYALAPGFPGDKAFSSAEGCRLVRG